MDEGRARRRERPDPDARGEEVRAHPTVAETAEDGRGEHVDPEKGRERPALLRVGHRDVPSDHLDVGGEHIAIDVVEEAFARLYRGEAEVFPVVAGRGDRADTFFGAMDGGQATAKDYNRGFYGPYMNVSIGLGG